MKKILICQIAHIGDVVVCSIKSALPEGMVKKKQIVRAVVVRTRKTISRRSGSRISICRACALSVSLTARALRSGVFVF